LFEQLSVRDRAAIGLAGLVTFRLRADILGEPLTLGFTELAERVVKEGAVKGNPGRVQLLDDCDIQTLLREQHFDIAAAARSWNGSVEQRLGEKAASEGERLRGWLIDAIPALDPGGELKPDVWEGVGAQDEAPPGSLFQRDPGLNNRAIFLERSGKGRVDRDGVRRR
jgi:hypothetical protein